MVKYKYNGKDVVEVEYIGMWKPGEVKEIPDELNYRIIAIGRPDLFELEGNKSSSEPKKAEVKK